MQFKHYGTINPLRSSFPKVSRLMESGVSKGVFPGAVLLAARGEDLLFHQAFGYANLVPERQPLRTDTVFDLASLTKPLATTLAIMILTAQGRLALDNPLPFWAGKSKAKAAREITLRQLLAHSSGLPAYVPYYTRLLQQRGNKKNRLRHWIIDEPLLSPPGAQTLYSDLGFIILEWLIEETTGEDLEVWTRKNIYQPLGLPQMGFRPLLKSGVLHPENYAATEDCPWRKKILRGEVHDDNAWAVGGVSGQAGLFATALEVFQLLRVLKRGFDKPRTIGLFSGKWTRSFWEKQKHPLGTTRALGFDTPTRTGSSAGRFFSPRTVGHLGFTGTSFWFDLEKDIMVILLTNRIHPTRTNEKIKAFRPKIHDQIFKEIFQDSF
ncbi:MAG: serine hydrolase domain-containing protein [Thermodesulfobacteriota bacterium]